MDRFWIRTLGGLAAVIASVVLTSTRAQAAFITTLPSWNGFSDIGTFGEPNTATYGQTITVGATDTFLTDFSFRMRTFDGATSRFEGIVMKWDQATFRAVGPVLFSSGLKTNTGPGTGFNNINITTNVNLTQNTQYVLFLSASNFFNSSNENSNFGYIPGNPGAYSGGQFVYQNNGSNFALLTSNSWESFGGNDLAFTANLTPGPAVNPTPAPAGAVLFGLGFAGLGLFRSFRKGAKAIPTAVA